MSVVARHKINNTQSMNALLKLFMLLLAVLLSDSTYAKSETRLNLGLFATQRPQYKSDFADGAELGLELLTEYKYFFNRNLNFQISPWARANALVKDSAQRSILEPEELAVSYKQSSFKATLGFHRRTWEGTDLVNPMDLTSASIYLDPLTPRPRSSAGLYCTDQVGNISWDFSFVPKQNKSILPGERSPWWPRSLSLPLQTDGLELRLPSDIAYQINEDVVLDKALDNNVGLRLQLNINSLDIALAGFEGSSQAPLLIPTLTVTPIEVLPKQVFLLSSPVVVTPTYFRRRAAAAMVTWSSSPWVFRAAGQQIQPLGDSPLLPGWSDLFVAGIERSFLVSNRDLTLLLQVVGNKKAESSSLATLSSLYEKAVMVGVRLQASESVTYLSAFLQEQKTFSLFFHNELKLRHNDQWASQILIDIFEGKVDSPLGTFNKNDQLTYRLSWAY